MNKIVEEARSWVGTPFVHQGRVKQQGVDCLGLAVGVLSSFGVKSMSFDKPVEHFDLLDYSRFPRGDRLLVEVSRHINHKHRRPTREKLCPGDFVLIAWRESPQHVGIISDHPQGIGIIHAWSTIGKCVEHFLSDEWAKKITDSFEVEEWQ
jgi:cell wall-associated NlpC family hydrolase